jgi:hypothetical protein
VKKDWRRIGKGDGQQQRNDDYLNAIAGNERAGPLSLRNLKGSEESTWHGSWRIGKGRDCLC